MKKLFALSLAAAAVFASTGAYAACTDLTTRQANVDSLCKPQSKYTCVTSASKTAEEYDRLKAAGSACKAARVATNKCFDPPDKGHLDAVKVVGAAVDNCNRLANNARSSAKAAAAAAKRKGAATTP